jgi:uncharacterized protein (DUF1330 family)
VPAYVIADVREVRDADALIEYRRRNTDVVAAHGGRFVVRGGESVVLEGEWDTQRVVVIEFPDAAAARGWYESAGYAPLKKLRQGASDTSIILVEGVG